MEETVQKAGESLSFLESLHINWLLIAVILIIVAGIIFGAVKGALKMIFVIVATVLAISLTILLSPITKAKMMSSPSIYNFFYSKTEAIAEKNKWAQTIAMLLEEKEDKPESGGTESIDLIGELMDAMGVPEKFKESVVGDESVIANIEASSDADVNERSESIQKGVYTGITNVIVKAVAFLLTLLIVGIVLAMLGGVTNLLGHLPGIDKVNSIVGAMAGGLIALVIVWIIFAVITMFSATAFGQKMLALITENPILSFIYNHNFINKRILS